MDEKEVEGIKDFVNKSQIIKKSSSWKVKSNSEKNTKSTFSTTNIINLVEKSLERCPINTSEELIRLKYAIDDSLCRRESSGQNVGVLKLLSYTKINDKETNKIEKSSKLSKMPSKIKNEMKLSKMPSEQSLTKYGSGDHKLPTKMPISRNNRQKMNNTIEMLKAGQGILKRAQTVELTLTGLSIVRGDIKIVTLEEQKAIISKPKIPANIKMLLEQQFNQMSVILDCLGLTGIGGLVRERWEQLKSPVRCLFNVTYEWPLLKQSDLETYRIPVADDKKEDISIYFDEVADKIEQVRQTNHSTVIHCMAGVSRSASLVIAYLIRYQKMSAKEAFKHTKKIRPFINPNLSFLEQLVHYEWKCFELEQRDKETKLIPITINNITKLLPDFIINEYLDEYQLEFI